MTTRTIVPGTRPVSHGMQRIKPVEDSEILDVLLLLRAKGDELPIDVSALGATVVDARQHLDPVELSRVRGASEDDASAVREFAGHHGLEVVSENPRARTIVVRGSVADMNRAFAVELHHYSKGDEIVRSHEAEIYVPEELDGVITGVFGLNDRKASRRTSDDSDNGPRPPPVDANTKPPSAFRDLYLFPKDATGKGQCVAILEFAGGFEKDKLNEYLERLGTKPPTVIVREIGDGKNRPVNRPGTLNADVEVYMDIEVVAGIAPEATLAVYFGENTSKGWVEVIRETICDTPHHPSVLSISWGQWEGYWDEQTRAALDEAFQEAALMGITVCCASGDYGVYESEDREPWTVAFPASSPHVLTCGGTRTESLPDGRLKEYVWNQSDIAGLASGGGVSQFYDLPSFQSKVGVPKRSATGSSGRGIPDVAANASSASGYLIWSDDTEMSMGGTSAAAPFWGALVACLNDSLGTRIGYLTPLLYQGGAAEEGGLRDVNEGDNCNQWMPGKLGYTASEGWDACTGLGTPRGEALLQWLRGAGNG